MYQVRFVLQHLCILSVDTINADNAIGAEGARALAEAVTVSVCLEALLLLGEPCTPAIVVCVTVLHNGQETSSEMMARVQLLRC